MKASKGNKVYTIDETQKKSYVVQGFDILDDIGEIIQHGAGKTVPYDKYVELEEKAAKLEKENKKLKDEIKELKKGA
ncbi:hypothetical protein [Clostridium sp. UBA871]|uniref:hypothetical protein n=1 Tax=Clostridium sp. UBA871 TaxID=1946380 RepID=UPI0032168578